MELTMENVPRNVDLSAGKFATAPSTIAKEASPSVFKYI